MDTWSVHFRWSAPSLVLVWTSSVDVQRSQVTEKFLSIEESTNFHTPAPLELHPLNANTDAVMETQGSADAGILCKILTVGWTQLVRQHLWWTNDTLRIYPLFTWIHLPLGCSWLVHPPPLIVVHSTPVLNKRLNPQSLLSHVYMDPIVCFCVVSFSCRLQQNSSVQVQVELRARNCGFG